MTITEPAALVATCSVVSNVFVTADQTDQPGKCFRWYSFLTAEQVHSPVLLQVLILTMYLTRMVAQLLVQ